MLYQFLPSFLFSFASFVPVNDFFHFLPYFFFCWPLFINRFMFQRKFKKGQKKFTKIFKSKFKTDLGYLTHVETISSLKNHVFHHHTVTEQQLTLLGQFRAIDKWRSQGGHRGGLHPPPPRLDNCPLKKAIFCDFQVYFDFETPPPPSTIRNC